jgi:hypothetical protein
VKISHPDQDLFQVHYRYGPKALFFFSNQNKKNSVGFHAGFNTGKKIPWKWDPETGQKQRFPFEESPDELYIKIGPVESLLLVFEDTEEPGPVLPPEYKESVYHTIDAEWQMSCNPHTGTQFNVELPELIDLASSPDERLNSFAGIIEYTTYIEFIESIDLVLDLGKVYGVTEVYVNDNHLGIRWYGNHRYEVRDLLREGSNEIRVKLTTTLYNYCRTQSENPEIKRWLRTTDPEPSGLIGPVSLITTQNIQQYESNTR